MPTQKHFFIWDECSVGWNAWIGLPYRTEPWGKIAFEDWRKKQTASESQHLDSKLPATRFYDLIKVNKEFIFSFHGSLNCNAPLTVSCKSCSPVPPVYTFAHACTMWCILYFSLQDYLGRKALQRCNNIIYNLFLWEPLRLWNRYSSMQVGG